MAINRNELVLREYEEKQCIAFVYILKSEKEEKARFMFKKQDSQSWKLIVLIPDVMTVDLITMNQFTFGIPKEKIPLETIAGIGINLFQRQLKEQVQMYTSLDFDIGQIIKET